MLRGRLPPSRGRCCKQKGAEKRRNGTRGGMVGMQQCMHSFSGTCRLVVRYRIVPVRSHACRNQLFVRIPWRIQWRRHTAPNVKRRWLWKESNRIRRKAARNVIRLFARTAVWRIVSIRPAIRSFGRRGDPQAAPRGRCVGTRRIETLDFAIHNALTRFLVELSGKW